MEEKVDVALEGAEEQEKVEENFAEEMMEEGDGRRGERDRR